MDFSGNYILLLLTIVTCAVLQPTSSSKQSCSARLYREGLASEECKSSEQKTDYFVLSQQWLPSVCLAKSIEKEACKIPSNVTTWTVHGLWPTNNNNVLCPSYCNTSASFDPDKIQSLAAQLNKYWPNVLTDTKADDFWLHEYCKHGTCCQPFPNMKTEFEFFQFTLKLAASFNLTHMLSKDSINPSEQHGFSAQKLQTYLHDSLKYKPNLFCRVIELEENSSKFSRQYLSEIHICMTTSMKLMDCPDKATMYSSMSDSSSTMYSFKSYSDECRLTEDLYYCPLHTPNKSPLCSVS